MNAYLLEHDISSLRALPAAEEYYRRSSRQFAVLHFPYEIRGPALPLRWQYGSFSLACEASCAPLLTAPPLGGTRHSDHHDFFAHGILW